MKEYDKENKSEMKSTNHCNNKTSRNVTASRKDKTTYIALVKKTKQLLTKLHEFRDQVTRETFDWNSSWIFFELWFQLVPVSYHVIC